MFNGDTDGDGDGDGDGADIDDDVVCRETSLSKKRKKRRHHGLYCQPTSTVFDGMY